MCRRYFLPTEILTLIDVKMITGNIYSPQGAMGILKYECKTTPGTPSEKPNDRLTPNDTLAHGKGEASVVSHANRQ